MTNDSTSVNVVVSSVYSGISEKEAAKVFTAYLSSIMGIGYYHCKKQYHNPNWKPASACYEAAEIIKKMGMLKKSGPVIAEFLRSEAVKGTFSLHNLLGPK